MNRRPKSRAERLREIHARRPAIEPAPRPAEPIKAAIRLVPVPHPEFNKTPAGVSLTAAWRRPSRGPLAALFLKPRSEDQA